MVARAPGLAFAQMWAELLGRHGIASRITPVALDVNVLVPGESEYEVSVAATDAVRARGLLPPPEPSRRTDDYR